MFGQSPEKPRSTSWPKKKCHQKSNRIVVKIDGGGVGGLNLKRSFGQVGSMILVELNGPWMAKFPHGERQRWGFKARENKVVPRTRTELVGMDVAS
jgi:hypothetical protein